MKKGGGITVFRQSVKQTKNNTDNTDFQQEERTVNIIFPDTHFDMEIMVMDIRERSDEQDWKTWKREKNDSPSQFPILLTHQLHFDRSPFQKKDHINWQTWGEETFIYQYILSVWESRGGRIRLLIKITSCPSYTRFIHLSSFRHDFCSAYLLQRVKGPKTHHSPSFPPLSRGICVGREHRNQEVTVEGSPSTNSIIAVIIMIFDSLLLMNQSISYVCLSLSLSSSLMIPWAISWYCVQSSLDFFLSSLCSSYWLTFLIQYLCLVVFHLNILSTQSLILFLLQFIVSLAHSFPPSFLFHWIEGEKVYFSYVKPGKEKRRISLSNLSHL